MNETSALRTFMTEKQILARRAGTSIPTDERPGELQAALWQPGTGLLPVYIRLLPDEIANFIRITTNQKNNKPVALFQLTAEKTLTLGKAAACIVSATTKSVDKFYRLNSNVEAQWLLNYAAIRFPWGSTSTRRTANTP